MIPLAWLGCFGFFLWLMCGPLERVMREIEDD